MEAEAEVRVRIPESRESRRPGISSFRHPGIVRSRVSGAVGLPARGVEPGPNPPCPPVPPGAAVLHDPGALGEVCGGSGDDAGAARG